MGDAEEKTVEIKLKCTNDQFYEFFERKSKLLPLACGDIVQKVEFLDDNSSGIDTAGSVKQIYYTPTAGDSEHAKYIVERVSNASKKIKFNVQEGPMMANYKFFKVTLELTHENSAKWTVEYHKISADKPDPDVYLNLFLHASAEVDDYIRNP